MRLSHKFTQFVATIFLVFFHPMDSFAEMRDEFFLKPFGSLEYSAPNVIGGGVNSDLKTNLPEKQIADFENIAVGGHLRIHKFVGLNTNWAQTELSNDSLQGYSLSHKPRFKMDQYNLSALFYAPIIDDDFELFAEAGVSDMNTKLTYATSEGNSVVRKVHETMAVYGAGFQFTFSDNSDDSFRFSFQKYSGKLALLNAYYSTIRFGYLKSF